jgi:hypothetical protein
LNISPKVGMTFTSKNPLMPSETTSTVTGYFIADLTLLLQLDGLLDVGASRLRMVSRIPPISPAWMRFTKRLSNTFGCLRSASAKVEP